MRYISLFSGIEAASVAWEDLGWEAVAFSEIEPFPCTVLEYRYPNVPNLGDITQIDWKEVVDTYGAIDLIVGGSPCQSFSIAGGREGLDGESRLMYEYIRAIHEVRPKWFLWENVPGVFSTDTGRAFGILLDEMAKCGYLCAWRVLDAQFFGVAQRRRRVFLVGHLGGGGEPAAVLFEPEGLRWDTKSSREKREKLTRTSKNSSSGSCHGLNRQVIPENCTAQGPVESEEICPTLDTGAHAVMAFDTGNITSPDNKSKPDFGRECHTLSATNHVPCIALQSDGTTSLNSNGDGYQTDGSAYTLNTIDHQSVMCVSNTTVNASIDDDLCGTLLVGGGYSVDSQITNSSNQDFVGALCATDYKGIRNQCVGEGKIILQRVSRYD